MTTLALEALTDDPFDLALAAPRLTLWRRGHDVRINVDERQVAGLRRALAVRGVAAGVIPPDPLVAPPLVRALGRGLAPAILGPDELDIVDVRLVPLAEATAYALRRPLRPWPLGQRRRSRCRALLRGADALLEIRRTAWCARQTLRANRRTFRPVLFDRAAGAPPLRVYASERLLTQWIRG
ncbi:MAG TPA: hypothetical protein VGT60_06500 [Candidatus Limnocylindria bacterium]|nr:hypothetical protein [Candidatus Limnocylindria bacterium]